MKRIDMLIGIVLALAAVGSAVGVLTYEDVRGATTFDVVWSTRAVALDAAPMEITGGGTVDIPLDISVANVSSVLVNVTVSGPGPRLQDANVLVELIPPAGYEPTSGEGTLATGATSSVLTVPLAVSVATVPNATSVAAASPEAAVAAAPGGNATAGHGMWGVRVTIAGGSPGPVAETLTVTVEAHVIAYEAQARVRVPDVEGGR